MDRSNNIYMKRKKYVAVGAMVNDQDTCQQQILNSIDFELRIHMAVMKSNIQFLKKFCTADNHLSIEESYMLCEDAIDDILRFTNCINFLNEANQNAIRVKNKRFNLNAFIFQMIEELQQSKYDVSRIQVNLAVQDLSIVTDKYLLNRIFINLLVNALKFSASSVDLFISMINNQMTVAIRDYGIGIPNDEITTIFSPFKRASNAKMIKGTGLGLSIVSKAVECLKGTIYVNSIINKGSVFVFIIPVEIENEMELMANKTNNGII